MPSIEFTVPGAPKGKGRPRFARATGRAYTPANTVKFENLVSHCASVAMAGRALFEGPLELAMIAYFAIPASWPAKRRAAALIGIERPTGKPDVDNLMKAVDALNGIVWGDDSQVVDGRMRKLYGTTPRLEIAIKSCF